MTAACSRLTSKYQATIPPAVRQALRLGAGDRIAFEVDGSRVVVRRAEPADAAFAAAVAATLAEWDSAEDDEAFGAL